MAAPDPAGHLLRRLHTSAERRARWGDAVDAGFVRLSIGCEPFGELLAGHRGGTGCGTKLTHRAMQLNRHEQGS
jgi:hypothetical protein